MVCILLELRNGCFEAPRHHGSFLCGVIFLGRLRHLSRFSYLWCLDYVYSAPPTRDVWRIPARKVSESVFLFLVTILFRSHGDLKRKVVMLRLKRSDMFLAKMWLFVGL